MFKRILTALRNFFFPPPGARMSAMLIAYLTLGILALGIFVGGAYAWDYTNSPTFCGTQCHTMPPEYTTYQLSPHARISCTECHIGREFVGNQFLRKAGDIKHVIALAFTTYEYPITANDMRPAPQICERCHSPEKFSDDSLRVIQRYQMDQANTPYSIYLVLKTGGGSKRQGLGKGIHWHVENKILYYAEEETRKQEIPYVRVYQADGSYVEYVDIESDFDPAQVDESKLEQMDCMTCHNRITHLIPQPNEAVDSAMQRGLIDPAIPDIKLKSVEALQVQYPSVAVALSGLAAVEDYYRVAYPDFYAVNTEKIQAAVATLKEIYQSSVFPDQKEDWNSHPNNLGHKDFAGCMRCHDGKHLNDEQEAVRLECNLCHSIPTVSTQQKVVSNIEVSRGLEPETHKNPNWITGHRTYFDRTCANCHTVDNPGGTDNSSFCSNSQCHGVKWEFAGFDAPGLAELVKAQLPPPAPDLPTGVATPTYAGLQPFLDANCGLCHGDDLAGGLKVTDYVGIMLGGQDGPVVIPGDPDNSLIVQVQSGDHFAVLDANTLDVLKQWIADGAPEQ
ncbi:MAG: NapC/NirT family cytochrome c [Anaerolineales bacterium]|nr:NapC/NirT family cytochrome c [Anaerolineales bacterium]